MPAIAATRLPAAGPRKRKAKPSPPPPRRLCPFTRELNPASTSAIQTAAPNKVLRFFIVLLWHSKSSVHVDPENTPSETGDTDGTDCGMLYKYVIVGMNVYKEKPFRSFARLSISLSLRSRTGVRTRRGESRSLAIALDSVPHQHSFRFSRLWHQNPASQTLNAETF